MLERATEGQVMLSDQDKADSFFFILKGEVSIIGKNNLIKDWNGKYKKFKQLQEWKKLSFDIKANEVRGRLLRNEDVK